MTDRMRTARKLLARVRELGANLDLDDETGRFAVINERKLPAPARTMLVGFASELAMVLRQEGEDIDERAAIIEFDGKAPREWAWQFAEILIRKRPPGTTDADWSWFITRCGQIIDAGSEEVTA